jgi:hypothetical protein
MRAKVLKRRTMAEAATPGVPRTLMTNMNVIRLPVSTILRPGTGIPFRSISVAICIQLSAAEAKPDVETAGAVDPDVQHRPERVRQRCPQRGTGHARPGPGPSPMINIALKTKLDGMTVKLTSIGVRVSTHASRPRSR